MLCNATYNALYNATYNYAKNSLILTLLSNDNEEYLSSIFGNRSLDQQYGTRLRCKITFSPAPVFQWHFTGLQFPPARHILITMKIKNKNWLQFLFIVKTAVLKQQIPKFYQIQRAEARDHIYFSQRPVINVKAIFCA